MGKIILIVIVIVIFAIAVIVSALAVSAGKHDDRAADDEMQMQAIAEMQASKQRNK